MNLFVLARDPVLAAQYHCDKHVVKMILETAQMLCTAHHVLHVRGRDAMLPGLYRATHNNHPCAVWVRKTRGNYWWAYNLFLALCDEYRHRYGKVHLCDKKLRYTLSTYPPSIPEGNQTPFAQAMPDVYRNPNTVTAYRNYYVGEKSAILNWTNRPVPEWAKKAVEKT